MIVRKSAVLPVCLKLQASLKSFDLPLGGGIHAEVEELLLEEFKDLCAVVCEVITPRIREANVICKLSAI